MANEVSISHSNAIGGFDILESQVQDFEYAAHRHSEVVIAAYTAGAKLATCGTRQFAIGAGDILVIGPETLHKATTIKGRGWRYRSAYLTLEQISVSTGVSLTEVERRVAGHQLHHGATELVIKFLWALEGAKGQPLALAECLNDLLTKSDLVEVKPTCISGSIKVVHDYLADDPSSRITLIELAELAGLSPEYLSRQFKAAYGLSPFQFQTTARVRMAKRLIASEISLSETAYAVGFADQSHLCRWFKRVYGVSPGIFAESQMRSRLAG